MSVTNRGPHRSNLESRRTRRRTRQTTQQGSGTAAPREKKRTTPTPEDSPTGKLEGNNTTMQNSHMSKLENDAKTPIPSADHPTAADIKRKHRYPITTDDEYNQENQHAEHRSRHGTPAQNADPPPAVQGPNKSWD